MAQTKAKTKKPVTEKTIIQQEPVKAEPVIIQKSKEETPPVPVKAKAEPKILNPIDKWNALKLQLITNFPIFKPGELDIINCTPDDMRVHVETRLSMTEEQIRKIVPEY